MDVGAIQKAERQMLLDGKSGSEIDAMKSAYRKQVFNPQGYSTDGGIGSFSSGGEAYGPPPLRGPKPQGINMADGGEVMNGIGTLNETARAMTRGPRGIGSYKQYADGGPVYMSGGGSSEVAARRASKEDLDNLSAMIQENYGFNPVDVALEQGIDPELALRVMYEESKGKQSAGSEKGARGLMQLMPETAEELGVNIDDALENYTGGVRYLKQMTDEFGLELGLAAYNAGPGNVAEYGGVPPFKETQNYLRIIAEPFTGNSVEEVINTGAENYMMNQPVYSEADVARGSGMTPPSRPLSFDQPYYQGIRPQSRPKNLDPAMDLNPKMGVEMINKELQDQSLAEKYSVDNMAKELGAPQMRPQGRPQGMPPVGIMSAIR